MFNRKQMLTSLTKTGRKPLRNVAQQQNNSTLYNNHNLGSSSKLTTKQVLSKKKTSFSSVTSENKKLAKPNETQNEKQSADKHAIFYDYFERNTEQVERQQQNCQNYFLRRTIMGLFKLFEKLQMRWDLYELSYPQLVKILHWLGYIRSEENSLSKKVSEDLKKCYWVWVNISQGKTFSLCNLIIVLCCIEHLDYDEELIHDIVRQLTKGIQQLSACSPVDDPQYIFIVKNERFQFHKGSLKLTKQDIIKIQTYLKDLRYNKLMQNSSHYDGQSQEGLSFIPISKKSEQLAETKRQKMLNQIRQKQPNVEEIELYHLLSYKSTQQKENTTKSVKTQCGPTDEQKRVKKQRNQKNTKVNTNPNEYLMEESVRTTPNQSNKFMPQTKTIQKKSQKGKRQNKINSETQQREMADGKFKRYESRATESQFEFSQSEELFAIAQQAGELKQQIIDELEWEAIPKPAEEIKMQYELFQAKDDFVFQPPLTHTFSKVTQDDCKDKQRKRKEYLDLPILFVDVNIEEGKKERIVIYEGDEARDLAFEFGKKFGLNEEMISRLESLLEMQIGSILTKIEEANDEDCSELY